MSLVIGGLYSFFAAAPAIMMDELGLTSLQLGLYFAATVLIVFAAGFLAPRLAHRWGQRTIGLLGLFIALAGSIFLFAFAAAPTLMPFTIALGLYLLGMGLINPLGTAIALHPLGRRPGWPPRCSVSCRWAARPSARRSPAFCLFSRLLPSQSS